MGTNASADLHVHSCYSDGRLTPRDLAVRARRNNVTALAIVDHDTLAGDDAKEAECAAAGVEYVRGVELSCEYDGRETHILGLFADPRSPWAARLDELRLARENRMRLMLEKLSNLGVSLGMEDLPAGDGVVGRPHLARALVAKGVVKTVAEAFSRYLFDKGPVHIPKLRLPAAEGIDLVKRLGGVAVLAHPGVSGLIGSLDGFLALGIDGVEAYHPKHGGETVAALLRRCRETGLLASGGSDFHAPGETPDIGSQKVPLDLLGPIRERAEVRRHAVRSLEKG